MEADDEPVKPDRIKSKSSLSLLWEEFFGGPLDLQTYVENCWNSIEMVDIDIDGEVEPECQTEKPANININENNCLKQAVFKDSGNSSLHDEEHLHLMTDQLPLILSKNCSILKTYCLEGGDKWSFVVNELIETETAYFSSLKDVEEGYLNLYSCRFHQGSDKDLRTIFCNWKELRKFHFTFLTELRLTLSYGFDGLIRLAKLFQKTAHQFERLYTEYCINYIKSINHLNQIELESSDAWKYLNQCQIDLGHQLPLSTFLLKPVQRILKYQLLLQELLQNCKLVPNNSSVVSSILKALDAMVSVADRINERQSNEECQGRMQNLCSDIAQSYSNSISQVISVEDWGKPYLTTEMRVIGCKNYRTILLCQSVIVVAKKLSNNTNMMAYATGSSQINNRWEVTCVIECGSMMLFECIPKQPLGFYVVHIKDPNKKVTLIASTEDQKDDWCTKIKQLILSTYEENLISERNRKILLDKKQNVLSMPSMESTSISTNKVFKTFKEPDEESEDVALDLESSIREILELRPNSSCSGTQSSSSVPKENIVVPNKTNVIETVKFQDPSIYQKPVSRQKNIYLSQLNTDDDDYSSVTVDVNEEILRDCVNHNSDDTCLYDTTSSVQETYVRYIEMSKHKGQLTPEDVEDIFHPFHHPHFQPLNKQQSTSQSTNNKSEIEMLHMCSDQESLDSTNDTSSASDNTKHNKRKTASMDRNMRFQIHNNNNNNNNNIIVKSNNKSHNHHPTNGKKSLFASVRSMRGMRSYSEWNASSQGQDIKPGIVKRLFRVPSTKKEKSVVNHSITESTRSNSCTSNFNKSSSTGQMSKVPNNKVSKTLKSKAPPPPVSRSSSSSSSYSAFRVPEKPPRKPMDAQSDTTTTQNVKQLVTIFQSQST